MLPPRTALGLRGARESFKGAQQPPNSNQICDRICSRRHDGGAGAISDVTRFTLALSHSTGSTELAKAAEGES